MPVGREVVALAGLIAGMILMLLIYERRDGRLSSTSSPLLASYIFVRPESAPFLAIAFFFSLLLDEILYRRFLFYGLRVLIPSMISSSLIFCLAVHLSSSLQGVDVIASTLPGLLAYDIHTSNDPARMSIISLSLMALLLVLMFIADVVWAGVS